MKKRIRLERIQVKKLFDRFNYDIDLKNGHDVAILIAPNGCGKTTIFNLINFMLNPTIKGFADIVAIPFDECSISLSNRKKLRLKRNHTFKFCNYNNLEARARSFMEISGSGSLDVYKNALLHTQLMMSVGKNNINVSKTLMEHTKHDELPYDDDGFMNIPPYLDEELPFDDLSDSTSKEYLIEQIKKFLTDNACDISINYTRADRLHNKPGDHISYGSSRSDKDPIQMAVEYMQRILNGLREQYNILQSRAKDQLPKEYLAADEKSPALSEIEFLEKWNKYVSDIEKFRDLGLIDIADPMMGNKDLKAAYKSKGAFLCVYLKAFETTLKPFESEYNRLKLFVDILNERNRITGKNFKYGKEGIILSVNGNSLPLSCMSSGEKNDFIMFYTLIFNDVENGLELIDEPEISLHIEWQETYLDYLIKICEMNGLQAIVATHSPNIVNGHFELYAEKGLAYDQG